MGRADCLGKETGRVTGWLGYGLMWADRQFAEINDGKRFPAKFDNRHKLNVVANWKLSDKVGLTGSWTFMTRKPPYRFFRKLRRPRTGIFLPTQLPFLRLWIHGRT